MLAKTGVNSYIGPNPGDLDIPDWPATLPAINPKTHKYLKQIKPKVFVDVYDVLAAWKVTNPALQHLIKKALQAGNRGHKDLLEDLDDIVVSANRALQLGKEFNE